jgi:hypothetical protein
MNNPIIRKALPLGIAVLFALTLAVSMAFGSTIYTNPTDFETATSDFGEPTIIDFEDIDASPINNSINGREPFNGDYYAEQGITFSNPYNYPLFISPGGLFWNVDNSLSVARFPFEGDEEPIYYYNDDDLLIAFDPPCSAVAFTFVDNGSQGMEEYIQFKDSLGNLIQQVNFPTNYTDYRAFLGIVSETPIATINILEDPNDEDDVNYDNFICYKSVLYVQIDIKPGSDPNCFNNNGHGVIPVAILTTDTFDAASVDPFSVVLDGASARVKGKSGNAGALEDIDNDGDLDLVIQIEDVDGTYQAGDAIASLTGITFEGIQIQGEDTICIVP